MMRLLPGFLILGAGCIGEEDVGGQEKMGREENVVAGSEMVIYLFFVICYLYYRLTVEAVLSSIIAGVLADMRLSRSTTRKFMP
jgi:hypothetical protein